MDDVYTHGHQESVLRSHRWRTAENSAGYLLPHLSEGMALLDVGCGPGTITWDLARRVLAAVGAGGGRVVGIDRETAVVEEAGSAAPPDLASNGRVEFQTGDVYHLDFEDGSFDVVHAHQVLQHLNDPVTALREINRVLRPGGLLAVRDSDYGGFVWAPAISGLDRWMSVYQSVCRRNKAEPNAGRFLPGWVLDAGFQDLQVSSSTWTFADPDARTWWAGLWSERVRSSSFAHQAVEYGLADESQLRSMAEGWREWAECPDGFFAVIHGEVLARSGR